MDAQANLATGTVATAPSPGDSGTSLTLTSGQGTRFPATPFNATVWPASASPDPSNAEIIRVTAVSTDTLTIVRAQEGTTAQTITAGFRIAATFTKKTLDEIIYGLADPGLSAPLAYRPWRAALANYGAAKAKLVVIGDSIGEGQGAGNDSARYVAKIQDALRRRVGITGGDGYRPVYYESGITQPATTAVGAAPGTLTKDVRYGLGGRSYQLAKTATVTFTRVCTGFTVHYAKDSFGVNLIVKVDGTTQATINCNGTAAGGFTQTVSGLTAASHTIELSCSDLSSGFIAVPAGIDFHNGDATTGISVYDSSHFGWVTDSHTAEHMKSVAAVAPQCAVIALGTNDCLISTPAQYQTKLASLLSRFRAAVTTPCTVIFVMNPERGDDGTNAKQGAWSDYVLAARAVAATDTYAAVIDLGEHLGKVSGNTLSLFADLIHLNVAGNAFAGDVLFTALTNGS